MAKQKKSRIVTDVVEETNQSPVHKEEPVKSVPQSNYPVVPENYEYPEGVYVAKTDITLKWRKGMVIPHDVVEKWKSMGINTSLYF